MRRREFIARIAGAASAWPLAVRAQEGERVRRIGVLIGGSETARRSLMPALREALAKLGWIEGRNLTIDLRYYDNEPDRMLRYATEMVSLAPEVILVNSTPATRVMLQRTSTIPIIFTLVADPVSTGLVKSLARPEGNATGFPISEPSIGGKWVELLKEAAPHIVRVAVIYSNEYNPQISVGGGFAASIERAAAVLAITVIKIPVQNAADIQRAIDAFAVEPSGGLILPTDVVVNAQLQTVLRLAVQHRLPAIYNLGYFSVQGALMTYGSDPVDILRRAGSYIDRLLRGTNLTELPVQMPTKFVLNVNLKAAKAIGLTIPETILARADEVIE
jgi:putative tryptophan/tyrosine transport system substrate-binding protein